MVTENIALKQGQDLNLAANDITPLSAYFESFIDNASLPVLNSIYPYETISNPFDLALFEYLTADIKAFEEKLASLAPLEKPPVDFINASFEELLDTPVDSSAENTKVSYNGSSASVSSEEQNLSTSDSFGVVSSGTNSPFVVSKSLDAVTSNSTISDGSNPSPVSSSNYIANISQGPFQASPPEQAFSFRFSLAALDALALPTIFGKPKNLLDANPPVKGDSVAIDGIADNPNGPFHLKNILDNDPNAVRILLKGAEIVAVDKNGGFTFVAHNALPQAETFYFRVNELDRFGNVVEQRIGVAHVSEIQDQAYTTIFHDGKFTADGNVTLTSNTGLLAHSAAAGDAVLSIISINPTLNSMDPSTDTFVDLAASNGFQVFSNFNIPDTTLSILADGSFSFSTTSTTSLVLNYIVSDGLGQTALASATFTPNVPPVVLDLTGNGINLVSAEHSPVTLGSLTGTHDATSVGWIGDGNGILMYDPHGSGELTSLNQISFVSYLPGAQTDLAGLAAFDSNHNAQFDNGDDKFNLFNVLFADGSFESLSELGIVSISLNSNNQTQSINGNTVFGETTFQTADGQNHVAADVGLGLANSSKAVQVVVITPEPAHTEQLAAAETHF